MVQKKTVRTLLFLWMGSLAGAGFSFLTQVVLARSLTAEEFGQFSSALAMCSILIPLVGLGLSSFWLKVFGQEGVNARRWVAGSLLIVLLNTLVTLLFLFGWAFGLQDDRSYAHLLLLMSFFLLSQVIVELAAVIYQLESRFLLLSIWQSSPHILRFGVVAITAYTFLGEYDLYIAGMSYAVVSGFVLIIGLHALTHACISDLHLEKRPHQNGSDAAIRTVRPHLKIIIRESWPYGAAGFFYLVYFQSSIILLKFLDSDIAAGNFNVIFLILQAVYIFPSVVFQKYLMPKIHIYAYSDVRQLISLYKKGNKLMGITGCVAMISVMVISPVLIPWLFGPSYTEVIVPLMLISVSIPLRFISTSSGSMLATKNNIRVRVKYMTWAAIVNVCMNFALVPVAGIYGAVISAVVCDLLIYFLYRFAVKKNILFPQLN